MFLFAFFWASSHSYLAPTVEIGGIWPPKGIGILDPWEIPLLNTSSGAAVTWAHHAILAGKERFDSLGRQAVKPITTKSIS
jgi:cytochrome c oxidase subunit 3